MAVQAGLLNAQIPMSAGASVPDIQGVQNAYKGYTMKGDMVQQDVNTMQAKDTINDEAAMKDYLAGGGDLATPAGADKSILDLKGKTSPSMYAKLVDHASKLKEQDVKLKGDLASLDGEKLKVRSAQLDQTLSWLSQPLSAYEESSKIKGAQAASVDFAQARDKILAQAAQAKDADGKPIYPPEILQQLAQADPAHLKAMMSSTKWHKDQVDEAYKNSQIDRNRALGNYDDERAKAVRDGKVGQGAPSEVAKIRADVDAGRLTAEQGDKMIEGIVAKKGAPADVSGLSPDAIKNAAMSHYLNGDLPARITPAERSKILNESADLAKANGDSAEEATIRAKANKASNVAINDLGKRIALNDAFERDADKRLGLVLELSKKADQGGMPALNRWINGGKIAIAGDVDVNNLNSAMISAQAELAKVLSGSLGNAAVSDSARQEASTIINKYMSPEMIESLVPNIRREMKMKSESWKEERDELRKSTMTPNTQRKGATTEKVSPEDQKARDADAGKIMGDELKKERAALAAFTPEQRKDPDLADKINRKKGDVDALIREMKQKGLPIPDEGAAAPAPAPAAKGAIPAGWSVKVK